MHVTEVVDPHVHSQGRILHGWPPDVPTAPASWMSELQVVPAQLGQLTPAQTALDGGLNEQPGLLIGQAVIHGLGAT